MKLKIIAATICLISALAPFENTHAQGLHIQQGGRLILRGNVHLVLQDASFNNDGVFNANSSTVTFTGRAQTSMGGSAPLNFDKVVVHKPTEPLVMRATAFIAGKISMSAGILDLNGNDLMLHPNAFIEGENESAHITGVNGGSVTISKVIQTPMLRLNLGNVGIELTTKVAPGLLLVKRKHLVETSPNGLSSIHRSFDVKATNNNDLNASARFFYLDAELAGHEEATLTMWKGNDIGSFWSPMIRTDADITANWVLQQDIQQWSRFTLAGSEISVGSMKRLTLPGGNSYAGKMEMQAYPNPARESVTASIYFNEAKDVMVGLYNQEGKLLQRKKVHLNIGRTQVQWDLGQYAAGTYYLVVEKININNIKLVKK